MPKLYTFPTLYDEALQIDIGKLKRWGYLKPDQIKQGTLNWSINEVGVASISILVNMKDPKPYIILDYNYKGNPKQVIVYLTYLFSNLNGAKIIYFQCPHTNKRCRKLYAIGDTFAHREAFEGCLYDKQTKSKEYREFEKLILIDTLNMELNKKSFRKTYAGKPTKKYLRIMNRIDNAERKLYGNSFAL